MVNIIKGKIKNVVDEVTYERLYKPNGWRIDESAEIVGESLVDKVKTQSELRNLTKMKKTKNKEFSDKIFYSEVDNEDKGDI